MQDLILKERISGTCGQSDGGWGSITSIAGCDAGAIAMEWNDIEASTRSWLDRPTGCVLYSSGDMYFNTQTTNVTCSSGKK